MRVNGVNTRDYEGIVGQCSTLEARKKDFFDNWLMLGTTSAGNKVTMRGIKHKEKMQKIC